MNALIIVAIIIIVAFFTFYYLKYGEFPIMEANRKRLRDSFKKPIEMLDMTVGHVQDEVVDTAIKRGENQEAVTAHNEKRGARENYAEAIPNAFALGELYYFNTPNRDRGIYYYHLAQQRINERPDEALQNPYIEPEIVFDRLEQLGIEQMINEDAHIALTQARNKTDDKKEYFNRKVRNDPQNVHDSAVNNTLVKKFEALSKSTSKSRPLAELKKLIKNYREKDYEKSKDALKAFRKISNNPAKISILNTTDKEVLKKVWSRTVDNENLEEAIINSLADCVEKNKYGGEKHIVCTTGRVGRIIDSMTCIDKNEVLSGAPKTTDILRKEILNMAYQTIQELPEEELEIYNSGEENEQLEDIQSKLSDKIREKAKNDYKDVDKKIVGKLVNEALLGI